MSPCPARAVMILLPLALAIAGHAMAVECYNGMVYTKQTGQLPYRESHWLQDGTRPAPDLRIGLKTCMAGATAPQMRSCGTP